MVASRKLGRSESEKIPLPLPTLDPTLPRTESVSITSTNQQPQSVSLEIRNENKEVYQQQQQGNTFIKSLQNLSSTQEKEPNHVRHRTRSSRSRSHTSGNDSAQNNTHGNTTVSSHTDVQRLQAPTMAATRAVPPSPVPSFYCIPKRLQIVSVSTLQNTPTSFDQSPFHSFQSSSKPVPKVHSATSSARNRPAELVSQQTAKKCSRPLKRLAKDECNVLLSTEPAQLDTSIPVPKRPCNYNQPSSQRCIESLQSPFEGFLQDKILPDLEIIAVSSSEDGSQSETQGQDNPNNFVKNNIVAGKRSPPLKYKCFDKRPARRIPFPEHSKLKDPESSSTVVCTGSPAPATVKNTFLAKMTENAGVVDLINKGEVSVIPLSPSSTTSFYTNDACRSTDSSMEVSISNKGSVCIDQSLRNKRTENQQLIVDNSESDDGILDSDIYSQESSNASGSDIDEVLQVLLKPMDVYSKKTENESENATGGNEGKVENEVEESSQMGMDCNRHLLHISSGESYPNESDASHESQKHVVINTTKDCKVDPAESFVEDEYHDSFEEFNKSIAKTEEICDELKATKRSWCSIS